MEIKTKGSKGPSETWKLIIKSQVYSEPESLGFLN